MILDSTSILVDFLIEEIEAAVKEGDTTIVIKWNSGGGSIFAGFKLIHRMLDLQHKGIKFVGVVDRMCASMCFQTLQFMNERLAYPLAIDYGSSSFRWRRSILKEIVELLQTNVIMRMKSKGLKPITIKLYEKLILSDFFMNNITSIQLGLIDKVILPGSERKIPLRASQKSSQESSQKINNSFLLLCWYNDTDKGVS